jgi:hypothetical protein
MTKTYITEYEFLSHLIQMHRIDEAKKYSSNTFKYLDKTLYSAVKIGNFQEAQKLIDATLLKKYEEFEEWRLKEQAAWYEKVNREYSESYRRPQPYNGGWCPACHEDPCECSDPDAD